MGQRPRIPPPGHHRLACVISAYDPTPCAAEHCEPGCPTCAELDDARAYVEQRERMTSKRSHTQLDLSVEEALDRIR